MQTLIDAIDVLKQVDNFIQQGTSESFWQMLVYATAFTLPLIVLNKRRN